MALHYVSVTKNSNNHSEEEIDMQDGKIVNVNDSNFHFEIEQANVPVLVDFGATWCAPCKRLSATLGSIAEGYQGKVKFCYVDIQDAPASAQKFSVQSVPTLILFNRGAPAGSLLGNQSRSKIEELLSLAL